MTRLLLIRHATTHAVGKQLSGRMPGVNLNATGKAEAEKLARRLAHLPVHAVYSSPLERAMETAQPIAQLHNLEVTTCEDFLEIHFGDWTGKAFSALDSDSQFRLFNQFRSCTRIPGGETMLEAQARMMNGLQRLCGQHPEQTVAVVSHSDMIKAALAYYAGIHLDLFQRIEISPASVSMVAVFEETVRIVTVNNTGGLAF